MSIQPCYEPECTSGDGAVELLIDPRTRDLGGFEVRRLLPSGRRRMVGPFIFLDEMGPAEFSPGQGIDVRPHPHIGIATITYLFDGTIMHRDSLGITQPIEPGAVNLMTAGRGIVHSERAGPDRAQRSRLHGIQSWIALPDEAEEIEPAFDHVPADALPAVAVRGGATVHLIMGEAFGAASPVPTYSPTLYAEARLPTGARLTVPDVPERAAFIVSGALEIEREHYEAGALVVFRSGRPAVLDASVDSRVMLLGGEPVGQRHIWWNFVSSSRERIEQAKRDWKEERFGKVVDDEDEFIPLPDG